jgi:SecD/SecF fusion protein
MLDGKKKISFSTKATAKVFLNADYKFIKKRKIFYVISALIIAGGIASLATKGLDAGVEFSGGRYYHVELSSSTDQQTLQDNLTIAFEGAIPEIKQVGNGGFGWSFTTKYKHTDKGANGTAIVENAMENALSDIGYAKAEDDESDKIAIARGMTNNAKINGVYRVIQSRQVDATISESLLKSSLIAIVLALIVIFAYIAFRFRKWQYGLGALIAMFHDVLVVLSIFSLCWDILPFSMEIDQAFIAAILTVVGYSINDTVVVFDRIREYLGVHRKQDHKEVINKALNSTLSRTINTSLSTFIVLLVIFIFADSIKGFTFALMIGVVVGTYSSLCIATPSVVDLSKDFDANSKKKKS